MEISIVSTWYDKAEVTIESVDVQVNREIRVGHLYKIQPTEAFLGIERGTVKVTSIGSASDLGEDTNLGDQATEFCRGYLDCMDEPYRSQEVERFNTQPWVVYQYITGEVLVLPLEEFVVHTTNY